MRRAGALILVLLAVGLQAAEDGGQPLAFTKLAVGARPAAMGGAYAAIGGDAYGLASNPALIATLQDLRLGSQLAALPTGRSLQYISFVRPVELSGGSAYGLAYDRNSLDTPIEKRVSNTPDPDSTFGEGADVVSAAYAGWLWPRLLACGLSFKVLGAHLGDASAGGFGADLGFLARAWPGLDLGFSLQDLASKLTWNSGYADNLPLLMRGSAAWSPWSDRVLLSVQLEKSQPQAMKFETGVELWVLPKALALRGGWADGQFSAGLGIDSAGFGQEKLFGLSMDVGFDYALVADPIGDGAWQHRFSLNLGYGLGS